MKRLKFIADTNKELGFFVLNAVYSVSIPKQNLWSNWMENFTGSVNNKTDMYT